MGGTRGHGDEEKSPFAVTEHMPSRDTSKRSLMRDRGTTGVDIVRGEAIAGGSANQSHKGMRERRGGGDSGERR